MHKKKNKKINDVRGMLRNRYCTALHSINSRFDLLSLPHREQVHICRTSQQHPQM